MPHSDPEKYRAYQKEYRERNKDKAKAYHDEWRKRNPEKVREASRKGNQRYTKAEKAAFARSWRQRNPEKDAANQARRSARRRNAAVGVADFTAEQWKQLKAQFQHKCVYCSKKKPLTQDHIIPLSKGGMHTFTNIVPACQSCNSRKSIKPAHEFVTLETFNWPVLQPAPVAA